MVIRWHWLAERQLKNIYDYYLGVAESRTAMKIVSRIRESVETLGLMPYMAAVEASLDDESEVFRSLVVARRYKAIYYVDEENETIVVADIWDCRQNPETLRERVEETIEI